MKVKRVFLPRWQRKVFVPLFILIWFFVTYEEFFSEAKGDLGIVGYVIMSAIFLGVAVMMWLMTSGKLPAYIIKEETDEE